MKTKQELAEEMPAQRTYPVVEHVWLKITNICEKGKFRVTLEINGQDYGDLFYSYPDQEEGVISQGHNLTWLIAKSAQVKALKVKLAHEEQCNHEQALKIEKAHAHIQELKAEIARLKDRHESKYLGRV